MPIDNGDLCPSCNLLQLPKWRGEKESARICQYCGWAELRSLGIFKQKEKQKEFDPTEPKKTKEINDYKPLGEPKSPHAIKYVARVYGVRGPKQIQAFGSCEEILKSWAHKILEWQGDRVIIFEYTEVIRSIIEKPREPKEEITQCQQTENTVTKI
jgi:Zn ribbon nucleic-acid-binding protein